MHTECKNWSHNRLVKHVYRQQRKTPLVTDWQHLSDLSIWLAAASLPRRTVRTDAGGERLHLAELVKVELWTNSRSSRRNRWDCNPPEAWITRQINREPIIRGKVVLDQMLEKKILKSKRKWISRLLNLYASTSRRATISRIPRQPAPQTPNLIFTHYDGLTHKWLDILYLLWQRPDYAKATYLTFRKLVSSYPLKVRKFRYLYSTFTKNSNMVAL